MMVTLNVETGDAALEHRNKDVDLNAEQKNKDLDVEMKMWLWTPNEKWTTTLNAKQKIW